MSVLDKFSCIADKCKHSCCIGWEIDIDDETYELYKNVNGDFGRRLMANIRTEGGCHSFILDDNERCPFLNDKNLCDIILNLGEEYLSDICNEHPRFYVNINERRGDKDYNPADVEAECEYECGLGMCCEEAARLILEETGDYDYGFKQIIEEASELPNIGSPAQICDAVDFLLELEQLGDEWGRLLGRLRDNAEIVLESYVPSRYFNQKYLNILNYLLFRHGDGDFALFIMQILFVLSELIKIDNSGDFTTENLIELCRVYSSEIEYSDENVQKIMAWIRR